jgi:hypothetical protein
MACLSNREPPMARGNKRHGARSFLAVLGLTLGWLGAVQVAGGTARVLVRVRFSELLVHHKSIHQAQRRMPEGLR